MSINGIKTKFKINNNHQGIITREVFEKTQRKMDERNQKFNKDKEPINKSYYYKYVYSPIIHKYLQKKTNYRNGISNEVLVDYDSKNPEIKPIAIKCIDQAIDAAINKLTSDLNYTFNRLDLLTNNIILSNKIDEEINQVNEEIDYLKERIDSLSQINITKEMKDQLYSETNSELITKEFALIELKNKKLLEYDFKNNLIKFKKLLKDNKDSTDKDKKLLIPKIIALDRENIILCIHLSNKKIEDINLDDCIQGEIVESDNFIYKQNRNEFIVNWKVIII